MLTTNLPRQPFTPHMRGHLNVSRQPAKSNPARHALHVSSAADRAEIEQAFGAVTAWRMALKQAEANHAALLARYEATPLPITAPIDCSTRRERHAKLMHAELLVLNAQAQLDRTLVAAS